MQSKKANKKLIEQRQCGKIRIRKIISQRKENQIIINDYPCLQFASNDYLGLCNHQLIQHELIKGVKKYGHGSGSSNQVAGHYNVQDQFEKKLAEWLQVEEAMVFSSGYLANLGAISALANRHTIITADRYCHASIIDGIKLSRAKLYRYHHNSLSHLVENYEKYAPKLTITESVFSMQGDIAPLQQLAKQAVRYQSNMIIDDSHGIGILGDEGRAGIKPISEGTIAQGCLTASLGKAFNSIGGIVAGTSATIETIRQFASSHRYTTALLPSIFKGLIKTLEIIKDEHWRRIKLAKVIDYFNNQAIQRGIPLSTVNPTPIKSILIGCNFKVQAIQQALLEKGIYVAAMRPPTVPDKKACIRVSLNCNHSFYEINHLLLNVQQVLENA